MSEPATKRLYRGRSLRQIWYDTSPPDDPNITSAELRYVLRPWWERFWRWAMRWDSCRTFWGSHGCDKRRGHWGRHRCGGIVRDRCCRGYDAPPLWAFWRADPTHYFGEDVPGDPYSDCDT